MVKAYDRFLGHIFAWFEGKWDLLRYLLKWCGESWKTISTQSLLILRDTVSFHSTRGLKQGDPLSQALFILGAEVLSRFLNRTHNQQDYDGLFI